MKQSNRTTSPQAPSLEGLAALGELSATTRLVLIGLAAWPELTTAALARRLNVHRNTVRRALAEAQTAGVIHLGPSTTTERGPIGWGQVVTPPSGGGAPRATPPAGVVRHVPPGGAPRATSAPLPGMASSCREVGQRQGRTPPTPPLDSPPSPEPASATTASELREAISKVRRLRRENGLATGVAYDRDIGRVLVSVLGQAHREGLTATLDDVAEAAGVALVVTVPAIVVALNRKVAPASSGRRPTPRASVMGTAADFAEAAAAFDQAAVIRSLGG
jgi:hypothetical protein